MNIFVRRISILLLMTLFLIMITTIPVAAQTDCDTSQILEMKLMESANLYFLNTFGGQDWVYDSTVYHLNALTEAHQVVGGTVACYQISFPYELPGMESLPEPLTTLYLPSSPLVVGVLPQSDVASAQSFFGAEGTSILLGPTQTFRAGTSHHLQVDDSGNYPRVDVGSSYVIALSLSNDSAIQLAADVEIMFWQIHKPRGSASDYPTIYGDLIQTISETMGSGATVPPVVIGPICTICVDRDITEWVPRIGIFELPNWATFPDAQTIITLDPRTNPYFEPYPIFGDAPEGIGAVNVATIPDWQMQPIWAYEVLPIFEEAIEQIGAGIMIGP